MIFHPHLLHSPLRHPLSSDLHLSSKQD
jgi:hypothetical protein